MGALNKRARKKKRHFDSGGFVSGDPAVTQLAASGALNYASSSGILNSITSTLPSAASTLASYAPYLGGVLGLGEGIYDYTQGNVQAGNGAIAGGVGAVLGTMYGGPFGAFMLEPFFEQIGSSIGPKITVGPNENATITGYNPSTEQASFTSGSDNGGTPSTASGTEQDWVNNLNNIVNGMGGTVQNLAPLSVGIYNTDSPTAPAPYNISDTAAGGTQSDAEFGSERSAEMGWLARELSNADITGLSSSQMASIGNNGSGKYNFTLDPSYGATTITPATSPWYSQYLNTLGQTDAARADQTTPGKVMRQHGGPVRRSSVLNFARRRA